ncbi:MAG: DUF4388 domain-containing protein, partial [Verrucomicrobiota bacterium]
PSLISICQLERTSGLLVLNDDKDESGFLYLNEGECVSAKSIGKTKLTNDEALAFLIGWRKGSFEINPMSTANIPREIKVSMESIMLKAATANDETLIEF